MIKKVNKILIVGGGSAGWMTAALLLKFYPEKQISLVESPTIPTIGVGESTLGRIKNFCAMLEINELDFMSFTDASYKMSIKFTDFYEKDGGHFHYPFGKPFMLDTDWGMRHWMFRKSLNPNLDNTDFVNSYFPSAALFEKNKFTTDSTGLGNYNPTLDVAYHFDAVKFALWLNEKYCKPRGVTHILGTITNINQNTDGITSLDIDTGESLSADLYIDCSGFRSLLLGDALTVPFNSYADILPNNKAWACQVPYIDKEKEIEPFTNCTAIGNGWCWNTPLWSRIGTGYVYSDKHISDDDALEEFKDYLCSDKMVIPRSRSQIDQLKFRQVPFRVGIHKQTFVKNVVAIGLSAGFIEPLESNGLFSVHEFLFLLLKTLLRGPITQWDRDVYNTSVQTMFKDFAQFVALHYALSNRTDTKYWKENANRIYDKGMVNLDPSISTGFSSLQNNKMFVEASHPVEGITYISVGMNYPMLDVIGQRWHENYDGVDHKEMFKEVFEMLDKNKDKWQQAANNAPSLYEYLKNKIYNV
jgi:tryptophan halogenase